MRLSSQLDLERCPHCNIDKPSLIQMYEGKTQNYQQDNIRYWRCYNCQRCGGVVLAYSGSKEGTVKAFYPSTTIISEAIPQTAREYLKQALDSLHAPAGSVILCASAIDAMLKEKGLEDGTLYTRIGLAVEQLLITPEMGAWAHDVRLDANDQRHADTNASLPNEADASKCLEFTFALAEILFVLPDRVARGRRNAQSGSGATENQN